MGDNTDNKQIRRPGISKPTTRIIAGFELIAALASESDLNAVDDATREHLLVDAWILLGRRQLEEEGISRDDEKAWAALLGFHATLVSVLRTIFTADAEIDRGNRPRLRWTISIDQPLGYGFVSMMHERVLFAFDDPPSQLVQFLEIALLIAIHSDPFPLRRCLHCSRVFVSGTDIRRIYCSRSCTTAAADRRRQIHASPAYKKAKRAALKAAREWGKANPDRDPFAKAKFVAEDGTEAAGWGELVAPNRRQAAAKSPAGPRKSTRK